MNQDEENASMEDPEYQQGVMASDNSLDPSEFEPDEHFADEGGANFEVFPTSTSHDSGRRRMTSRNRLIVGVVLLGVAVALALVFSGGNKDGTSLGSPPVALEEPPADLDSTCSPKALADDGKEACLEDCERAECCDFPSNLPLSCLEGNQQKCLVYHASCSNLNADSYDDSTIPSSVPPAPSNLGELCTAASLRTVDGFTGCHGACKHAECCYEKGVGTCTHDECEGYAPCLTLAATDHVHDDIPVIVDQVCATDRLATLEGRAECRQACSHALCCFVNDGTSCPHQDDSFCSQYDKCNELESVQPVDATPQEIQSTCQDDQGEPGHISLCELVCQKGACCYSDDGCNQVAPGTQCGDYEPCRKVFVGGDNEEVPSNDESDKDNESDEDNGGGYIDEGQGVDWDPQSVDKDAIDSACEANMVVEVIMPPDQPSLCQQVCRPGVCCFDKDVHCDVDDPERFCTIYSACSKLHPNAEEENANPPVNEQALKEACQQKDLEECENLCQQGICCFEGDVCDVPHPERFCAHFGYCEALDAEDEFVDDDGVGDDDEFDDDDEMNDDGLDYEEIAGDENGDEDVDEGWIDQVDGGNGNTNDYDPDDEIIEIMVVDGVVVGADVLQNACNDNSPHCETLCQQGACCFNAVCPFDNPALYCSAFDGYCDKFFLDDDEDDDEEDTDESWVDEVTGGNNDQDDEIVEIVVVDGEVVGADVLRKTCEENSPHCETLCQQGACCFNSVCPEDDPVLFCSAFDGYCDKFYFDDDDEEEDDDGEEDWVDQITDGGDQGDGGPDDEIVEIRDVNGEIGGEEVLHKACTTGSVKCETLCKQGACCFEGGCSVPNPERFCVAFGVCEKYYQGE